MKVYPMAWSSPVKPSVKKGRKRAARSPGAGASVKSAKNPARISTTSTTTFPIVSHCRPPTANRVRRHA